MDTEIDTSSKPGPHRHCDSCHHDFQMGEYWFSCTICSVYLLCETCKLTIQPSHSHRLIRKYVYDCEEDTVSKMNRMDIGSRILAAIKTYEIRHCMGVRDKSGSNDIDYVNSYSWHTFETVGNRIKKFSIGLQRLLPPYECVGICASNRPEWIIADFACILQRFVTVPINFLLNECEMTFMINNTHISLVVCDKKMLARFIGLRSQCPSLRHLVCMDSVTEVAAGKYLHVEFKDRNMSLYLQVMMTLRFITWRTSEKMSRQASMNMCSTKVMNVLPLFIRAEVQDFRKEPCCPKMLSELFSRHRVHF